MTQHEKKNYKINVTGESQLYLLLRFILITQITCFE